MTEIKTLIAAEEPLEKRVSQVNLSQAHTFPGRCSRVWCKWKSQGVRVFCVWIKSACLSALCQAKQLDQQGGTHLGHLSLSLLLNTASASLCFPIMKQCLCQVRLKLQKYPWCQFPTCLTSLQSWAVNTVCAVRQNKEMCLCLWSLLLVKGCLSVISPL